MNDMFIEMADESICYSLPDSWFTHLHTDLTDLVSLAQCPLNMLNGASKKKQAPTRSGMQKHQQYHPWERSAVNVTDSDSSSSSSRSKENRKSLERAT